jgi:pimeloyl-ACP methyl ester carboxylesterase
LGNTSGSCIPILFLPGQLNSANFRPQFAATASTTAAHRATVFCVDRPGYGASSPLPSPVSYNAYASDLLRIAQSLCIPRFTLMAFSSGGPFAIACASQASLRGRVANLVLVSSDAPYLDYGGEMLVESFYRLKGLPGYQGPQSLAQGIPPALATQLASARAAALRQVYHAAREPKKSFLVSDLRRATAQGVAGAAVDCQLESSHWAQSCKALAGLQPRLPCDVFHGTKDADVPLSAAEYLLETIPHARAHLVGQESHSMIRRRWPQLLKTAWEGFRR